MTNIDRGGAPREYNPAGRNLRSVWSIPTEAYPGAHFATFPRKLVERCIKAGTSERGCCPECGAPWERETEVERVKHGSQPVRGGRQTYTPGNWDKSCFVTGLVPRYQTLGWRPTCQCFPAEIPVEQVREAWPVPCTVLDPFAGSGTTGVVALALGRRFIGCDLSAKYLHMAERRISRPHARVPRENGHEPLPLFASLLD